MLEKGQYNPKRVGHAENCCILAVSEDNRKSCERTSDSQRHAYHLFGRITLSSVQEAEQTTKDLITVNELLIDIDNS